VIITGLRIAGFKSFVDPVSTPIEAGLTGIVGPNGCGKSNVLEAVRWAMGAASARALRADDMDSVIFSGSAAKPARESAEVTLLLQTPAGETCEVTRRIRRDMGSSYKINGREARAKDVQLLFADASTGANSPALVRQGQVSELIAAKPENRRRVLEEAAGISGLHARRHEADLKLSAALVNLERLDEVAVEIDAQVQALRRQARQAARIKGLTLEMRKIEALLHARRIEDARTHAQERATAVAALWREEADAMAAEGMAARALEAAEAAWPGVKEEEAIAEALVRRADSDAAVIAREIETARADRERLDAQHRRLHAELERETHRRADAEASLAALAQEAAQLAAEDDADTRTQLQARAEHAEDHARNADAAWREAAARFLEDDSRHKAVQRAFASARAHWEAVSAHAKTAAIEAQSLHDALLDLTPVEEAARLADIAYATAQTEQSHARSAVEAANMAAEAAAHDARQAAAAASAATADLAALEARLNQARDPLLDAVTAAAGFEAAAAAAVHADAGSHWTQARPRTPPEWPASVTRLADHVTAPDALLLRVQWTGLVEGGADAAALLALLPAGARLVDRTGALWDWDGLTRSADASQAARLMLERRNAAAAMREKLPALRAHESERRAIADAAAATLKDARARLSERDAALKNARLRTDEARSALAKARTAGERDRAAAAAKTAQAHALSAAAQTAKAALDEAEAHARASRAPDPAAQTQAQADADRARAQAAQARSIALLAERAHAARVGRRAAIAKDRTDWLRRSDDAAQRISEFHADITATAEQIAAREALPITLQTAAAEAREAVLAASARLSHARDAMAVHDRALREAAAMLRDAQKTAQSLRETRIGAAALADAAHERVRDLIAATADALGLGDDQLHAAAGAIMDSALARGAISDIERKLDRMRAERDAAGPVNLRADEELQEIEERLATLSRERDDVASAVHKLRSGIGRINAEARTRLEAAFVTINAHFAALFQALFEGGEARLALTDNDDPLACGLEIYASPPGKRLTALSLMSGGEQALTATALIFAVFLANPAPLCVLDEVDAPLDDANVERFCRMLERMREMTQTRFLVITHNPITMARMDRLFGVTMPVAGASQIVSVDLAEARALAA
jgi:chromosome segregation protein